MLWESFQIRPIDFRVSDSFTTPGSVEPGHAFATAAVSWQGLTVQSVTLKQNEAN